MKMFIYGLLLLLMLGCNDNVVDNSSISDNNSTLLDINKSLNNINNGINNIDNKLTSDNNVTNIYQDFNNSITTYKFNINNAGGTVEVKYVGLDNKGITSFIVKQYRNDISYDIYFPTVFKTDLFIYIEAIVNIPENDTNSSMNNRIELMYIDDNKLNTVSVFNAVQETFESNLNIVINIDNTVENNTTLIIDTNATLENNTTT